MGLKTSTLPSLYFHVKQLLGTSIVYQSIEKNHEKIYAVNKFTLEIEMNHHITQNILLYSVGLKNDSVNNELISIMLIK